MLMTVTVVITATGRVVKASVYNYLPPLPIPFPFAFSKPLSGSPGGAT